MKQRIARLLRGRIRDAIVNVTSSGGGPKVDYSQPLGDAGLFGPDSVCWRVHADPTSMFVGGFAALMMQALEPRALAGVFDHSSFRQDPFGRLRRTSTFVMGTTYGPRADAEALIARVRARHRSVKGIAADGRPYAASNGELLTWVHVCEMYCFLRAHRRYVDPAMSLADQNRYYAEVALVAEKLGATAIPRSVAEVTAYLARMRPHLQAGAGARSIHDFLSKTRPPSIATWPFARLLYQASVDLLPEWASRLSGLQRFRLGRKLLARNAMRQVGPIMRWALAGQNAPFRSRQRMGLEAGVSTG